MRLTYEEVGASRTLPLPAGYHHLLSSAAVGQGAAAFRRGADLLLAFEVHRRAGVPVHTSAPVLAPGVRVEVRLGPVRAPCEVIYVVDEPTERGFGYGTLPGHPERGEELFLLTLDPDDTVTFVVRAFSRPGRWYTRLGGFAVPLVQKAYIARLSRVLRRYLAEV